MAKYQSPGHISIDGNLYEAANGIVDIPDEVLEKNPDVLVAHSLVPMPALKNTKGSKE